MSTIHIVDTTIFCNILQVPNRAALYAETFADFENFIQRGDVFLLPLTTVYETGNHIAQNGDGRQRREVAQIFCEQLRGAFAGEAPWTLTPIHDLDMMRQWLDEFPDFAMREIGFGDLAIIKVFEQQCELHPSRSVRVWSYDQHLQGYQRAP